MKYRPHRGSLQDSIEEACEVDGLRGLIDQLRKELAGWPFEFFADGTVKVERYCGDDDRIGWKDVHIVTIDGYGVMGFCEGPAE